MPADPLRDTRRVLVLAPTGRDAEILHAVLGEAGIATVICRDVDALCRGVAEGAGAAVIAEEALYPSGTAALSAVLERQEPWSDLPLVLLTTPGEHHDAQLRAIQLLEPAGRALILERPLRKVTMITAVEASLRTRRRQYQVRDAHAALVRAEHRRARAEALRKSEAIYRALARNFPNGFVLLVDPSLRCTLAEGMGLAAVGRSREAIEGRALGEVLEAHAAARFEAGCRGALAGRSSTDEVRLDGRIHLVHYVPLPGAEGDVEAAMLVTQDITLQKRAEEELRADAVLRERFVGVLAHDLRTPLQAISFSAEQLASGKLPPERVPVAAARTRRAAERMARMIGDLLDLTRARHGGGIPVRPRDTDLAAVTRAVIEEIQAANPGRRIVLTTSGDSRGTWDPDRLAQVVSNLLGNAVAYSPPDSDVTLGLRAEGDQVALAVHNWGEPIPPEALASLFDPFKRGPAGERENSRTGLGLGLFIADRIVREHQGEIGVTSSTAEGTRFTVTLPRRVRSPPAQAPAGPRRRAAPDDCAKPRRRVLVVEDDETAREALREILKHAGYDVTTAANGREALDLLASAPRPCVVLLDLMMPVMSGWQVLEALEQRGALSDLAVVAVSAATGACSAPIGVRHCLPKPLRAEALLAAVAESCGA